jgi:hypothetical protein
MNFINLVRGNHCRFTAGKIARGVAPFIAQLNIICENGLPTGERTGGLWSAYVNMASGILILMIGA